MNHQEFAQLLGSYGEFVGAIAVVATLLYLAVQIRHSSAQTAIQLEQSQYEQWQRASELVARSPQVADLLVRGQQSRIDLSEGEQIQFDMILTLGVNSVEFAYRRSDDHVNDPDAEAWLEVARFWLDNPGGKQFWEMRRDLFYPSFAGWIDTRLYRETTR